METFDYSAVTLSGKKAKGSISAASAREARDMLRARSLTPLELRAAKTAKASQKPGFSGAATPKFKHITQATRQLAILIDASTPIEEALRVTAQQFEGGPMRQVLMDVRAQVLEGARFSEALKAYPKVFSGLYIAMAAAGEGSGKLPAVLDRVASDLESVQAMRRKILAATIYPIVLSVVALIVVTVLMVLVVPKVVAQFETFGQTLPFLTRAVIATSSGIKAYGLYALGAAILLGGLWFMAMRQPELRLIASRALLKFPFIGTLIRNLNAARFARTAAGLMESGTPSLFALEAARHTLRSAAMRAAMGDAISRIREGSAMSPAIKATGVFPPLVVQMVAGGELGGDVGKMFAKSADYLEGEFDRVVAVFLALLEPLIIIAMSLIVLLIIAAIFLPILRLNVLVF